MQETTSSRDGSISIAIVGGGIAGLALALGIANKAPHIKLHVYEAASRFQEIGAGVAFNINAQRALQKLDPRLEEAYAKLHTSNADSNVNSRAGKKSTYLRVAMGMDHRRDAEWKAGKEICEIFCEGGLSSVHRARFLDALAALMPQDLRENGVSFGARLVSIEDMDTSNLSSGVRLVFANGSTATASAVIGCDGIKSQVRRALLGADSPAVRPVFTGIYAYRGLVPMSRATAALGDRSARNGHHRLGYDGHVLTFPIDLGKTMNVVAFRTASDGHWGEYDQAEWNQPATREAMHRDFAGWSDEVHKILDMMERCDKWALFDHLPATTYHRRGQICVIGDSAHASTPHHGSGAGMALEDACLLSALLANVRTASELDRAFESYETERKGRTERLVISSREQAAIYEFQGQGIGDDVHKIAEVLPRKWDWIWDHDIEEEIQAAQSHFDAACKDQV